MGYEVRGLLPGCLGGALGLPVALLALGASVTLLGQGWGRGAGRVNKVDALEKSAAL